MLQYDCGSVTVFYENDSPLPQLGSPRHQSLSIEWTAKTLPKDFVSRSSVFAVTLGPALIPGMPLEVASLWAVLVIIISPFVFISGRIYIERKNPVIPEPEIVIDSYTDLPMKVEPEAPLEPLTVKQSMNQGLSWTIYMYGVLIGAVILTVNYDDVILWFSSL